MFYGQVVVLKRDGQDGKIFALTNNEVLFGAGDHCDVKLQYREASAAEEQCKLTAHDSGEVSTNKQ